MEVIKNFKKAHKLSDSLLNKARILNAVTLRHLHMGQPRILMNTVPKSGTHLLRKCLELMPGIVYSGIHINHIRFHQYQSLVSRQSDLKRVGRGVFVSSHIPFSDSDHELLKHHDFNVIVMIRDPRDVVVSHLHHSLKRPVNRLHDRLNELPEGERLEQFILGVPDHHKPGLLGVPSVLNLSLIHI